MTANKFFRSKMLVVLVFALALLLSSMIPNNIVFATPSSGITAEVIATGTLAVPISSKFKTELGNVHTNVSKTTLVKYTITPGGVFGWHQHGGNLWVIVESGSLTFYEADDPACAGTVYVAGSTFMDPGNHIHNARNEGSVNLVIYAVFMLPAGGETRLDAPHPGTCPF